MELFYEVPASQAMPRRKPFNWQTHELVVRAQINLQGEARNWVFPAPPPADLLSYNASEHGEPKFDTIRRVGPLTSPPLPEDLRRLLE